MWQVQNKFPKATVTPLRVWLMLVTITNIHSNVMSFTVNVKTFAHGSSQLSSDRNPFTDGKM